MPGACRALTKQQRTAWQAALFWLLTTAASASAQSGPTPSVTPSATPPRVASLPGRLEGQQLYVKPGHWVSAQYELWAGEVDLRGTLVGTWLDEDGMALEYPPLRYGLRSEQDAVVPKTARRTFEQWLFVPNDSDRRTPPRYGSSSGDESHVRGAVGWFRVSTGPLVSVPELRTQVEALRDHQALFVVLAARPGDYGFLGSFDALTTPHTPTPFPEDEAHYRVVVVDDRQRAALPSTVMAWTTTAYVLWDGYDLARLSDEQRTALVDWLHWGGTLIVAGPGTLDLPVSDPLRAWLPAESGGVRELDEAALQPLVAATIAGKPLNATDRRWPGLQLTPHPQAEVTLGSEAAPLVVERRVGRGRVIVTAFRPSQVELTAWPSYAGFFNAYLLRRPARVWTLHPQSRERAVVAWADDRTIPTDQELRGGTPDPFFDPLRISGLRFFGRGDIGVGARPTLFNLEHPLGPGVAGCRDDDPVSAAAREAIRDAAGIFIPSVATVSWLVGGYVLLAIPLNWFVFRALKKPEWAWAALPVISVVYTIAVIRAAELDLGFVRSTSETTLVEIQPGYDRAHVTRFTSLFNSLGSTYTLVGEDPTTVSLPFPISLDPEARQTRQTYRLLRSDREAGQRSMVLDGLVVDSNSVAATRSEQMAPLGGTLTADMLSDDQVRIENHTQLELRDVQILISGSAGEGRGRCDTLAPGESALVRLGMKLDAGPEERTTQAFRNLFASSVPKNSLLLTATTPSPLPGLRLEPEPTQQRRTTIVVAVLRYGEAEPPSRDVNTRSVIEAQLQPNP